MRSWTCPGNPAIDLPTWRVSTSPLVGLPAAKVSLTGRAAETPCGLPTDPEALCNASC